MDDPPEKPTPQQRAAAIRDAIGAYHEASDHVRQAIKDGEADGLVVEHNLDAPLVAGEHIVSAISRMVPEQL